MVFSNLAPSLLGKKLYDSITAMPGVTNDDAREAAALGFNLATTLAIAYVGIRVLAHSYSLPLTGILLLAACFYAREICKAAMFSGVGGKVESAISKASTAAAKAANQLGFGSREAMKMSLPGYTPFPSFDRFVLFYITPQMKSAFGR